LTDGQLCPIVISMNGAEFIKKIKSAAKVKGLSCRLNASRGKGSHATLYLGESFTIVKDRKKEIGPGLLASMLADLGLTKEDLR
jgi:mRNA interferase HicA